MPSSFRRSENPPRALKRDLVPLPKLDAIVMYASQDAHTLRLCVEAGMFEETTREIRGVIRAHIQPHNAISRVTKSGVKEIPIQS